jgi:hypothetical protein
LELVHVEEINGDLLGLSPALETSDIMPDEVFVQEGDGCRRLAVAWRRRVQIDAFNRLARRVKRPYKRLYIRVKGFIYRRLTRAYRAVFERYKAIFARDICGFEACIRGDEVRAKSGA